MIENRFKFHYLLFFATFTLVLLQQWSGHTTCPAMLSLPRFTTILMIMASVVLFLESLTKYNDKYLLMICFTFILVIYGVFKLPGYFATTIWGCFAVLVGAKHVEFRKIVKYHFAVEIILLSINVLAYSTGYIDKSQLFLGDSRDSMFGYSVRRFEFGYPAATDFATHVFYILLDYWFLRRGLLKWLDFSLYAIIIVFVIVYCDARQPAVCILLMMFCSLYLRFKVYGKRDLGAVLGYSLVFSMPFFAIVSIYATAVYDSSNIHWATANLVTSGRLGYGYESIQDNGIQWLPRDVKMFGGGHVFKGEKYSYVDCTYLHYLLRWGILLFVTYMFAFLKISYRAWKRRDVVILFCLFFAGLSSVMTQFLFLYNYCILLLAFTASHDNGITNIISQRQKMKIAKIIKK